MMAESLRVLLLEDNPDDVFLVRHYLKNVSSASLEIEHCQRLEQAIERLRTGEPNLDVILMDLGLPDSCGLESFIRVRQQAPALPIVVLSGLDDERVAIQAVREGAQDYLVKGQVNGEMLLRSMHYSVARMRTEEALRRARDEMEIRVQERTSELALANEALKKLVVEVSQAGEAVRKGLHGIINVISLTIETRDPYTAGHQKGVADIAQLLAQKMNLPEDRIEGVRLAALVHDLGKISIPAEILAKPTRLNDVERSMIRIHPQSGYEILKRVEFPWPIAKIVLQHHERLDGSGYPQGLRAGEILLEAKIIGVADVVDAMCSHRPYRPAPGIDLALAEIRGNRGILYDPDIVDACLEHFAGKPPALEAADNNRSIITLDSPRLNPPPPLAT